MIMDLHYLMVQTVVETQMVELMLHGVGEQVENLLLIMLAVEMLPKAV